MYPFSYVAVNGKLLCVLAERGLAPIDIIVFCPAMAPAEDMTSTMNAANNAANSRFRLIQEISFNFDRLFRPWVNKGRVMESSMTNCRREFTRFTNKHLRAIYIEFLDLLF
jgi:hypothetical protein